MFTERDFPGAARNSGVAVRPDGLIYFSNEGGLLEFDGVTWRMVRGTGNEPLYAVAADPDGRVWYGALNHFGLVEPDAHGTSVARPRQVQPGVDDRTWRIQRQIALHRGTAYFLSAGSQRVAVARADGENKSIALGGRASSLFACEDGVFALIGRTAFRLDRGELEPAPALTAALRDEEPLTVRSAWPRADGGTWLVTEAGVRVWHLGKLRPTDGDVKRLLGNEAVTCGCPLGDGTFALGTGGRGLLIVDGDGRVLAHYDEGHGLGGATGAINGMALDAEGGLWLARRTGVMRVQWRTPLATHGASLGISGTVQAMVMHRGRLHVATSDGVFVREPTAGRFAALRGARADVWVFISTEDGLIMGGRVLQLRRDDGTVALLDSAPSVIRSAVRLPRDPERLVVGFSRGLRVYVRENGAWVREGDLAGVQGVPYRLTQDKHGWLWADSDARQVVRVDWRAGVRLAAPVETLGERHGLEMLRGNDLAVRLTMFDGEVALVGTRGVWRHDTTTDRFVPETRIAGLDPQAPWPRAYPLSDGSIWFGRTIGEPCLAIARITGPGAWQLETLPFVGIERDRPIVYCEDPADRTLWIGYLAVVSYDLAMRREFSAPPPARVRRVATVEGSVLWGGGGATPFAPLPPTENALRFAYAAPSHSTDTRGKLPVQYRTQLDGFDRRWSAWGTEVQRTYTNLPPGKFTFNVQARGGDWRAGPVGTFAFAVLPPWWRTWWFLGLAGATGVGGVAAVSRWYAQRVLRRRLALLEAQSAVERERLRLARDLHDEVGSGLGRVILFAEEAERERADPAQLAASLARVRDSAKDLVQHAREIVWAVSPQHDPLARVIERLGDYVEETLSAAGIACRVDGPTKPEEIPAVSLGSEARHSLFLAVKEAVHNCVKYSGAKTAEFRLGISGNDFVVTLRDHGRGFVAGEVAAGGTGHGLPGIAARAEVLGGRAEIVSAPGQGTSVTLRVPLVKPEA